MSAPTNNHLKYQAYVDGLRAVAVLSVIFYHADLGFSGGYVGVDVFFVISGYLITGLILKELEGGHFYITEFWERRVRRIFPALAVVVLITLVAGWFLYFPSDFKELGQSVLAQALLVSNIYFYEAAGYFAQGVEVKPLLHTWSLAVEEQFYLFFPFLLIVFKRFSKHSIIPAIFLLCGGSFILSVYCSYTHPRANFYLLPTRAWELSIGSFLAAVDSRRTSVRWLAESISWIGLLAVLFAIFCYDRETRFPGVAAILPCVGAAMVIWSNNVTLTSAGKLLAIRPIVFIGLISYSLYLWHWPVLVFFKYWAVAPLPPSQRFLLLLISLVLAVFSWKFVETPFRRRALLERRSHIFAFFGLTTAVMCLAGLVIFRLDGAPSRIPAAALQYLQENPVVEGDNNSISSRVLTLMDAQNGNFNFFGTTNLGQPIDLLVWGDSHAQVEIPMLDALCKEHSVRAVAATHSQTAPLVGYESRGVWSLNRDSLAFNDAVVEFVQSKHISNVIIIARWDYYITEDKGTDRLHRGIMATIEALQNSGAKIWIMRQVPKYSWNVPKALASAVLHGHDPEQLGRPVAEQRIEMQIQNPIFEGISSSNVTILDPTDFFVDASGRCRVAKDGKSLYFDTDHVNLAGAFMLRPLFEPIFNEDKKNSSPRLNKDFKQ